MPALRLLGRAWLVGSDDLVVPAAIGSFFRACLLGILLAFLYTLSNDISCTSDWCPAVFVERCTDLYVYGIMTLMGVTCVLEAVIAISSSKGRIMEEKSRKPVGMLIVVHVLVSILETAWTAWAAIVFLSPSLECKGDSPAHERDGKAFLRMIVWISIATIAWMFAGVLFAFDLSGHVDVADIDKLHRHWERRCNLLCCCMPREDDREIALRSLVKSLASWFSGLDLVPSDIFAALLLLNLWSSLSDTSCLDEICGRFEKAGRTMQNEDSEVLVEEAQVDRNGSDDQPLKLEGDEPRTSRPRHQEGACSDQVRTGTGSDEHEVEEHHSANAGDISMESFDSPGFISALMTATVSSIALGSNSSASDSHSQGSCTDPPVELAAPDVSRSPAELPLLSQLSTREPACSDMEIESDGRQQTTLEILRRAEMYIPYAIACYGMMLQVWRCCSNCCDGMCWILQNALCCRRFSRSRGDGWVDKNALGRELENRDYHVIVEAPADAFSPAFFVVADMTLKSVVLAIRGTFSISDTLTDGTAHCCLLPARVKSFVQGASRPRPEHPEEGEDEHFEFESNGPYGHAGMVQAAERLKMLLHDSNFLPLLLSEERISHELIRSGEEIPSCRGFRLVTDIDNGVETTDEETICRLWSGTLSELE
eukprot:768715-Hanusia_phi.AAC.9